MFNAVVTGLSIPLLPLVALPKLALRLLELEDADQILAHLYAVEVAKLVDDSPQIGVVAVLIPTLSNKYAPFDSIVYMILKNY